MPKRILVALDQSPLAESLAPVVADMARSSQATVRLLHVAPEPRDCVDASGRVVAYLDQEMARLGNEALDFLRAVEVHFDGVRVESVVRFGDPVSEILREAEAFDADLIALTTKGHGSISRTLLGSVSEQVFRKAETPVLLLRAGGPRPS